MLAIASVTNGNGAPGLNTNFLVASVEMIDDSSVKVWFTRKVANATDVANFLVSGPATRTVVLSQYEEDTRGVRLYFNEPLTIGEWVLGFVSSSTPGTIQSDDPDALFLLTSSQITFELVDKSTNSDLGNPVPLGEVARAIPKKYRVKKNIAATIAGIEAGDSIVKEQARLAFDQLFIVTASGPYLTQKAADVGVIKPWKLGISDDQFRKLIVDVISKKLTQDAFLSVLETVYGIDSVHAYVETALVEPYSVFDQGYVDLLIDGKTQFRLTVDWEDFQTPLRITAQEACLSFNFSFNKNNVPAVAIAKGGKVRIYSNTKGLQSSIAVTGGTLQPYFQFDSGVFDAIAINDLFDIEWTITNPSPGVVRFSPDPATAIPFSSYSVLKPGDYVTIIGSDFPEGLRGSHVVTDVNLTYSGSTLVEYFEISSNYTV